MPSAPYLRCVEVRRMVRCVAVEDDPAELGKRIAGADRPGAPHEQRLRFQWNVPQGTTPYVPLWLSLTVVGLIVAGIVGALLR